MAQKIMLTTGSGFEGYRIDEYLGVISSQEVLGTNFIKGLTASVSDTSEKDQMKLEDARELAEKRLIKAARKKKANAVIGVHMHYVLLDGGSFGIIISGTAVSVSKKVVISDAIHKELFVTNYYTRLVPRAVKVILDGNSSGINMKLQCYNYNNDDILAMRCDVEFVNLYEEHLVIRNEDFVFSGNNNLKEITSDYMQTQLAPNDISLLKDVKVVLNKYVTSRGVLACNDTPLNVEMSIHRLENLKAKRGIDAVAKYRTDGMIWTCNCGHVNEAGVEECVVCGRKQKDMQSKTSFNYEEMIDEMRSKEYVTEIKDILMQYIQEINPKFRLQLLEIMESGLQYEKTRGNMKDTVIEKVEKVFEDANDAE